MSKPTSKNGGPVQNFDIKFKLVIIGESAVGKTAILNHLRGNAFTPTMINTIGIDFIKRNYGFGGKQVQLEIWDTAGQERFNSISNFTYRGSKGLIFVYDCTSRDSLNRLRNYWLDSVNQVIEDPIPIFLIANKVDRKAFREVSTEEGKEFSMLQCFYGFYETSAKTGENIDSSFQSMLAILMDCWCPNDKGDIIITPSSTEVHANSTTSTARPHFPFTSSSKTKSLPPRAEKSHKSTGFRLLPGSTNVKKCCGRS